MLVENAAELSRLVLHTNRATVSTRRFSVLSWGGIYHCHGVQSLLVSCPLEHASQLEHYCVSADQSTLDAPKRLPLLLLGYLTLCIFFWCCETRMTLLRDRSVCGEIVIVIFRIGRQLARSRLVRHYEGWASPENRRSIRGGKLNAGRAPNINV